MAGEVRQPGRERKIVHLAERQQGLVTSRQLTAVGVGRRTIDRWVASGRLRRVHRGVYSVGPQPLTQRGRWLAGVLAKGPGAALSHQSAAALWGLVGDRREVDVTAPAGNQGKARHPGIRLHRAKLRRDEWMIRGGIPVTTVARTLFDLAETGEPHRLKSAWDEADRLRLLRIKQVAIVYERGRGRLARPLIQPFLDAEQRHVEDTASPLEGRFADFCATPPPAAAANQRPHRR